MKQHFNKKQLNEFIDSMVEEICSSLSEGEIPCVLGIRKGGAPLALILAQKLSKLYGEIDLGYIDVSLYRDDIHRRFPAPIEGTDITFSIENRTVFLVDDVLATGRTIRAAIGNVMALGRPRLIRLAVLVDRGGRELPIQADICAVTMDNVGSRKIRVVCLEGKEHGIFSEKI